MTEKESIKEIWLEFNTLKPNLQKFNGNPIPAMAERLILIINKMTPHAHLFDDDFKTCIKDFILTYEAACKGEKEGDKINTLLKPTNELIAKTLEKMVNE